MSNTEERGPQTGHEYEVYVEQPSGDEETVAFVLPERSRNRAEARARRQTGGKVIAVEHVATCEVVTETEWYYKYKLADPDTVDDWQQSPAYESEDEASNRLSTAVASVGEDAVAATDVESTERVTEVVAR